MKEISVELGERSYPIKIGRELLGRTDILPAYIPGERICVVTNEKVAGLYLDKLVAGLKGFETGSFIIPDGERHKNIDTWRKIVDHLLHEGVDRKSTVIALGGGVVGDIAGFAAASCLRGINLIQVPTTLLAQVDSSVGGKTGVNHPAGKNLIGAFYQPACVLADLDTLESLSSREFAAGMAEVIKYGLIRDAAFLNWLEENAAAVLRHDDEKLTHIVCRSCEIKADIVSRDEKETGLRAILNFGHTFGHAIESATGYSEWLHGEAISAGMVMAARLSASMGLISDHDADRITALFARYGLPTDAADSLTRKQMKQLMLHDKKTLGAVLHLVLLKQPGQAFVTSRFPKQLLEQVISNSLPA